MIEHFIGVLLRLGKSPTDPNFDKSRVTENPLPYAYLSLTGSPGAIVQQLSHFRPIRPRLSSRPLDWESRF